MESLIYEAMTNSKATIGFVCVLLIFSGIIALKSMTRDSPLAPYVLQILGLTFILPVVILITTIINVDAQAVMGLLGTIIGYIFGSSQGKNTPASGSNEPPK